MEFMIGTPMGAEVIVEAAPDHLGKGVVLHIRTHSISDRRHAEVFLDNKAVGALLVALEVFHDKVELGS